MKHLFVLIVFAFVTTTAKSQTTEDSVKQAVNKLFTAMKTSNAQLLKASFTDSAILQTIAIDRKTGQRQSRNEDIKDFAEQIAKLPKDSADERITFDMIKIDADLASVWTPYQFYYNGKFSHCGVNSFQLARINGLWKIQYLIDTRRRDNCVNK